MGKTIKPGTQQNRSFSIERAHINDDSRTVELAFSSETPYDRWWGREILDHSSNSIRLGRLKGGAPLLSDHNNSIKSQIGVVESVSIGNDRIGRAVVRFGKGAADDEIYQKVQDGIIRNVSVGYIIHKAVMEEENKDSLDVYRVTDWEPLEISLVAVPADSSVGVGRSLDDSPIINFNEGKKMAETQETVEKNTDALQVVKDQAKRDLDKEKRRVTDILALGKEYSDYDGVDLAQRAISDEKSVEDFQKELLLKIKERKTAPVVQPGKGAQVTERIEDDPLRGFRSVGQFCKFVRGVALNTKLPGDEQYRAATSFAESTVGEDGAYLIPPAFSAEIDRVAFSETSLLSLIGPTPIEGNSMSYPHTEATPWGTTGVQTYWEGEGDTFTPSKPTYKKNQLNLHKLTSLVNVTNEMLEDSTAMGVEVPRDMAMSIEWKVQDVLVNGTGAGMPLGIMNAPSTVSQAKETSQTAATVNANNVAKMLGRLLKGVGNVVWLANPDVMNQLYTMTLGNNAIWTPPAEGFKQAPNGLLLGRPIIETDACQTLGTVGDLILVNLSGFRAITKSGGMRLDRSMHLYFDQDLECFRLVFRLDARPRLQAAISPKNGSNTRSHFVTLATRA